MAPGSHGQNVSTWDPATLLRPTKFMAPLTSYPDRGTIAMNGYSPGLARPPAVTLHSASREPVFEFTTASDQHSTAPSYGDDRAPSANQQPPSLSRMVERMNNVQDRAIVPAVKRRRVDGDSEAEGGVTTSFSKKSAGMLASYIHQARDTTPSFAPPQSVDLTNDDDGEVEIKSPENEEYCFGMFSSRLHCHIVPSPKPGQQTIFGPAYLPAVKIMLKRLDGDKTLTISAYDHTREIIGKLDVTAASFLAPLLDTRIGLRTECRIPAQLKQPGDEPGRPTSRAYSLDVALYGPLKIADMTGKYLSTHSVNLRAPTMLQRGAKVWVPNAQSPSARLVSTAKSYAQIPSGDIQTAVPVNRTVEDIRHEVMGVFDSLKTTEDLAETEPDSVVKTPLLQHQKQGLYFMISREKDQDFQFNDPSMTSFWKVQPGVAGDKRYFNVITGQSERHPPDVTRGGILADMMGLGKTLSILSLITWSLAEAAHWATLAPVQPKIPPVKASAKLLPRPTAEPLGFTKLVKNAKATLLVCPLSTVTNWEEQIKQHIEPDRLRWHVYHGPGRIKDVAMLAEFDLVITTYGSISSELGARSKRKLGTYPLEEIAWFRIVLDEAHMIREHSTLQFKAIYRLQADRRWAVTGTPIQNRLDDLAALLTFLRVKPFDDRAKFQQHIVDPFKNCDPDIVPKLRVLVDTITLRRLKDRINLPPRTDQIIKLEFAAEERRVYDLFAKNAQDRVMVLAGTNNEKAVGGQTYIHILRSILRLRLICAHGIDLLNEDDLRVLQGMTADMAIEVTDDDEDERGAGLTERKAYEMFQLMQDTNHDGCIECGRKLGTTDGTSIESEGQEDLIGYMNPCFHVVCRACFKSFEQRCKNSLAPGQSSGPCPVCRQNRYVFFVELRRDQADDKHDGMSHDRTAATSTCGAGTGASTGAGRKQQQQQQRLGRYNGPHTKTRALLDELLQSRVASERDPTQPPYKSVVLSGWTNHLDLIERALNDVGIRYTRLDGRMSRAARTGAMDAFRDDPAIHVILVSIMAGGLGLNLTAGNSVYVMEPQFNPAAEAQAIDRVHRLGQTRPVRTVRFLMRDSFEERMLELQDKKLKLASLSMDGRGRALDKGEAARQKLLDLRSLFK